MYTLFGDSDFTARLAPALMGTSMVALPYVLRAQLGRIAAFAAAVLLAIGPSYLYFSRFAREDIYIAAITLAMLVVDLPLLRRPRRWHPAAFGALLARASPPRSRRSSRSSWPAASSWSRSSCRRAGTAACARRRSCARCSTLGWEPYGRGASPRSSASTRCCSRRSSRTRAAIYGLWTGLDYWLGQHERRPRRRAARLLLRRAVRRTSGRCCCSASSARSSAFRRPTLLRLFLVWAFVVSLVVYSWAGEKFAWLVLHPLLPLILLAGVGLQAIWAARRTLLGQGRARGRPRSRSPTRVYASVLVNAVHPADPREFLVSTQSSTDVADEARRDRRAGRAPRRQAEDHDRLRRGRDVPVGLVLPRPRRRLPRPRARPARRRSTAT